MCVQIFIYSHMHTHALSHTHISLLLLYGFLFSYCCCGCYSSFFAPVKISLNCNFLALNLPEDVRVLWGLVTWLATQFAGLVTNVAAYVLFLFVYINHELYMLWWSLTHARSRTHKYHEIVGDVSKWISITFCYDESGIRVSSKYLYRTAALHLSQP